MTVMDSYGISKKQAEAIKRAFENCLLDENWDRAIRIRAVNPDIISAEDEARLWNLKEAKEIKRGR